MKFVESGNGIRGALRIVEGKSAGVTAHFDSMWKKRGHSKGCKALFYQT